VARRNTGIRGARPASRRPKISPARLDALIEEAIVDAYTESEQAVGFHATIEQHLAAALRDRRAGSSGDREVRWTSPTVATSSRSAIVGASDKPSRFSSYRYRIRSRPAGNGSRRIDSGHEDAGSGA